MLSMKMPRIDVSAHPHTWCAGLLLSDHLPVSYSGIDEPLDTLHCRET